MTQRSDLFAAINFVKQFLQIFGHWPDKNKSIFKELLSLLLILLSTVFVVVNLADVAVKFKNFHLLAENLAVTMPVLAYVFKLVFFKMCKKQFFILIKVLQNSESLHTYPVEFDSHVGKMNSRLIFVMKFYAIMCIVVVTLYGCLALLSDAVLPIKLSFQFGKWIYGMFVFQITTILQTALNTVNLDMLIIFFMGAVISQLEILEKRILVLTDLNENQQIKNAMRYCVMHHIEIIQLVTALENVFSLMILTQYLCSIFTICNIGFDLAHLTPLSGDFTKTIIYFSAMMMQLAMYCWYGNEIVIKSMAISDACYGVEWLNFERPIQKSLLIVMIRSKRPLALTAGKFSLLSLRSLGSIMNASYSYFALMQRLYKDEM